MRTLPPVSSDRATSWFVLGEALILSMAAAALFMVVGSALADEGCPAVLDHQFKRLQDERPVSLCEYRGKVVLVVNTASYCAFTPQYEGLEKLYGQLRDRGLVVLGFPSNDFGGQEPGSSGEIADFCRLTYSVDFPMFEKTAVSGKAANPLFAELARRTGSAPRWNFHKYLIDRKGETVLAFGTTVSPDAAALRSSLESMLESGNAAR